MRAKHTTHLLMSILPWLLLWGAINTGSYQFQPITSFSHLVHFTRAMLPFIAAILALLLIARARHHWQDLWKGPVLLLALYGIIALVSSFMRSPDLDTSLYWGAAYLSVFPALYAVFAVKNAKQRMKEFLYLNRGIILTITTLTLVIAVLYGVKAFVITDFKHTFGQLGPNGIGRFAALTALIALVQLLRAKNTRAFWSLALAATLGLLLYSHSRAAILAFLIASGSMLFFKHRTIFGIAFLSLLLFGLLFSPLLLPYATKYQSASFLTGRLATWQELLQHATTAPLIGHGYHADRLLISGTQDTGYPTDNHAHNAILHALIQAGILGAMLFASALAWAAILAFQQLAGNTDALEAAALTIFFIVRGLFESSGAFFGVDLLIMLPAFAGLQYHGGNHG